MKRIEQSWSGPVKCKCSTCGAETDKGLELIRFDNKERKVVEQLGRYICPDCHREEHRQYEQRRKEQLAAEPRCEVPGCNRRGNYRALGVLICGMHLNRARKERARKQAGAGILAILDGGGYSKETMIRDATT